MKRLEPRQGGMWLPVTRVAESPGHRFYEKLNELLGEHNFDRQVEDLRLPFYQPTNARPTAKASAE